jgi:hypothetical protein
MRAFLIVLCAIALIVLGDGLLDRFSRVATFVRFACTFEGFVLDHPEFFSVVKAVGIKKRKNCNFLVLFNG